MALTPGTVTINPATEEVTGTGLALELYTADAATAELQDVPELGSTEPPFGQPARPVTEGDITLVRASRVRLLTELARQATARAEALAPRMFAFDAGTSPTATADYAANAGEMVLVNAIAGGFNVDLPGLSAGSHVVVRGLFNTANAVNVRQSAVVIATVVGLAGVILLCDKNNTWQPVGRYP